MNTLVRRAAILPLLPLDKIEDFWFQSLEDRDDANLTELTEPCNHRLRYRTIGRGRHTDVEPPWHKELTHYQQHRRMAQQT